METEYKPYRQGHLDKYCGIYCVVNTVHYLCGPLGEKQAGKLFYRILKLFDQQACAVERIGFGMCLGEISKLFDQVADSHQFRYYKPFGQNSGVSLDAYWQALDQFITANNGIVLINIMGSYNHWTLVKEVTDRHLLLFDSDGITKLNRRRCSTDKYDSRHKHILRPTHTHFIWTGEVGYE